MSQASYYHVRVSTKSNKTRDEVRLDLSQADLEASFLRPRREGRPIVVNGVTVLPDDLAGLKVNRTDQPSGVLSPIVLDQLRRSSVGTMLPLDWQIARYGEDVTNDVITEPAGSEAMFPHSPTSQEPYIDKAVTAAIRAKDGTASYDVAKLLKLIEELNDNYRAKNTYASHALLRAILDHIPPIFGQRDFTAVANNYKWSQTDKKYMKRLAEFKNQADDALHRQASDKPDLLDFDHMPTGVYVDRLLRECADLL